MLVVKGDRLFERNVGTARVALDQRIVRRAIFGVFFPVQHRDFPSKRTVDHDAYYGKEKKF